MMRSSGHRLFNVGFSWPALVTVALALSYGVAVTEAALGAQVRMDFRPLLASFPLGGPVLVEVTLTNLGDDPIDVDLGANSKEAYVFNITDPGGNTSQTTWRHEGGVFSFGDHHLAAGSRFTKLLVLNDWYSFDETGIYEIDARLAPRSDRGKASDVLSHEFMIVVEEDSEGLEELCSELAGKATNVNVEVSSFAASALSYVEDPVCIPFMEQALEEGRPLAGILQGLGRIATPEAVDVLERFLREGDLSAYQAAVFALSEVVERTDDEELRRRVEHLLESVPQPEVTIEPRVL